MPANITVIRTEDFIRATPEGRLDLEASRQVLTGLVAAIKASRTIQGVLIDTRETGPAKLSTNDLYQLGTALGTQSLLLDRRIALLVPPYKREDAEFFESLARLGGANLKAFDEFEPAITWLIMRQQLQ